MNPLIEWLGHGGNPVAPEVAEYRAEVCVACPENRAPRWWEKVKDPIADCIKGILGVKSSMNLSVQPEEQLHMCRVCGCCNRLKVWTPISHIRSHDDLSRFPEHCWIRRES